MRSVLLLVMLAGLALLVATAPAGAWAVNTHMCTANFVRQDVADDGAIEVWEVTPQADGTFTKRKLGDIPLPADLAAAIVACPQEFRAGSCCADAYPDMYVGQSVIHPFIPGQPWHATDWGRHLLKCAREYADRHPEVANEVLAYAAGWLVHFAGDAFGHTHVNKYAGGAWDWGDMDIVLKHVSYESYINTKLPGTGADTLDLALKANHSFIKEALMKHDEVQPSLEGVKYLRALLDYYWAFDQVLDEIEDLNSGVLGYFTGGAYGLDPLEDFAREQRDNADRALMEWAETSTRVIRDMSERDPLAAISAVEEWVGDHLPHLLGIPNAMEELADWLGAPIGWVTDPLQDGCDQLLTYVWKHLIRSTFERIVNPEVFMLEMHGPAVRAEVDALMGVTPGHPQLDPENFLPFYDTVVLAKLALLDEAGIKQLGNLLGVEIPTYGSDDNLLWDCIESLDASNQLALYPKFRLLETGELTEKAYRRLFKEEPYEQAPSAIDPCHLLLYGFGTAPRVGFVTPVPDPLNAQSRVRGSVYQRGEGAGEWQRVPIFENAIPTRGVRGTMVRPAKGEWSPPRYATYKFHLTTAATVAGSAELVEDRGVDVQVKVVRSDPGEYAALPKPPDTAGVAALLEAMLYSYQQLKSNPQAWAALTPEAQAAVNEALAKLPEAIRNAKAGLTTTPPPGTTDESVISTGQDPYVYAPQALATLTRIWSTMPTKKPDGTPAVHPVVGTIQDAEGKPVAGADVTLLEKAVYDELRAAHGVPLVRLDQWLPDKYQMGRTNAMGQFALPWGVHPGPWALIASAAGKPKVVRLLNLTFGNTCLITIPPIRLVAEEESASSGGAGGRGIGPHPLQPDFSLSVSTPVVTYAAAGPLGGVQARVRLRPLGGFAGSVRLSVQDVPEGVQVKFSRAVVPLPKPQEAVVIFKGGEEVKAGGMAQIVATAGRLEHRVPVVVSLAGGQLATKPQRLRIRPGESVVLRLTWAGPAGLHSAARVSLGELPPGLAVRAERLRPHLLVPALDLPTLTPDKFEQHREILRPQVPVPRVERPRLTQAQLNQVPALLPATGALLSGGGWLEVSVRAGEDMKPGSYLLSVHIKRGQYVQTEKVEITVLE